MLDRKFLQVPAQQPLLRCALRHWFQQPRGFACSAQLQADAQHAKKRILSQQPHATTAVQAAPVLASRVGREPGERSVPLPALRRLSIRASAIADHMQTAQSSDSDDDGFQLSAAADRAGEASSSGREDFCVVNFYHLTPLERPHAVIRQHREWLQDRDILGRIYITTQGINAQLSGPQEDAHAYAEWVGSQPGFEGLRWTSDPTNRHQFPRLRLKYRDNLVQLAGGTQRLPITNPQARAQPLGPQEWHEMLRAAEKLDTKPVVLDVRNSYEWDAGHFKGAERPLEEQFNETPTTDVPAPLQGADKDTPVLMYCTGGIRCDIYSTLLRERGYSNLYTLKGGVAAYLREMGSGEWKGSLFTFDDRMALAADGKVLRDANLASAAPCYCCGQPASLPHLNCANIDCNRLFLACPSCQGSMRGCCCSQCTEAPRYVRPAKAGGHYRAWHSTADPAELEQLKEAMRSGRGGGRQAKRQRRLERLKAKHAEIREQKARRREMVKAALAAMSKDEESEPTEERVRVTV